MNEAIRNALAMSDAEVDEAPEEHAAAETALVRIDALAEAVKDVCWKATPYGETDDGDTLAYLVPKGAMHRLIGAAQAAGIGATFPVGGGPTE